MRNRQRFYNHRHYKCYWTDWKTEPGRIGQYAQWYTVLSNEGFHERIAYSSFPGGTGEIPGDGMLDLTRQEDQDYVHQGIPVVEKERIRAWCLARLVQYLDKKDAPTHPKTS